jgi:signal peptidase I
MECPSCGTQNLPTGIRCYECGSYFDTDKNYLQAAEDSLKLGSPFHGWVRNLPLPNFMIDGQFHSLLFRLILVPFVWIPGLALWAMDHYEKGLAYLVLTLIPLLMGFTLFNHPVSNFLIPFGILSYLWCLVDSFYTWRERHQPVVQSFSLRINSMIFLVFSMMMVFLLWAPQLSFLRVPDERMTPVLQTGDYLLINPHPVINKTFRRGDLIAIKQNRSVTFGRVLGFSGENIYYHQGHFYIQSKEIDPGLRSMLDIRTSRRYDVPESSLLVVTSLDPNEMISYGKVETVSLHAIYGRVEAIFGPTERRRRLL